MLLTPEAIAAIRAGRGEPREIFDLLDAYEELQAAAQDLANEAARACTEPHRFHANEGERQQELGAAVAQVRHLTRNSA